MGYLNEDTGAVARVRIAAASAPMRQVDEHLDALGDDFVGGFAIDVGNKAEPAGVVLLRGVVEPLGGRESATAVVGRVLIWMRHSERHSVACGFAPV